MDDAHRKPPSGGAAAQVLNLPELLETILQNLAMKDLLLSQRVSRSFRRTVQGSVRLRRKLFLAPAWRRSDAQHATAKNNNNHDCLDRKPENNYLLCRAFREGYPTITPTPASPVDDASSSEDSGASALNSPIEQVSWDVNISFPADRLPTCAPAVSYPEASWRQMYLSQPPCTSLHLIRRWRKCERPAMQRDDGITMGHVFEEATRPLPHCREWKWHQSYISSDRDWHFEGHIRCDWGEDFGRY